MLDSIGDAVLSTDLDGRVTYLNRAAEALTGWMRAAAVGRPLDEVFQIIDRETRDPARNPLRLALRLDETVSLAPNCLLVRRDGQEAAIEDSAAPIHDRHGRVTGAVIVFRDVRAALEAAGRMAHLALHDALTGLPNRLLLHDRLRSAIALGRRHGRPVAVCFLDVDGFKGLNDSLGHAVGDRILQSIAARLAGALRQADTVSRYGGDEFVTVLSELEHAADADLVARKLLRAVAEPHRVDDREIHVTASVGVSLLGQGALDADALVANADAAMYEAKRAGGGSYRVFGGVTRRLARVAGAWHAPD